ncbi:MAG: hypothetical protein AAF224_03620 [Pseudomonadota bacterium]
MPVLFPSWRFFPEVGPSPRIEYALLSPSDEKPSTWMLFQERPATLSFVQSLKSFFWNPAGNKYLFLVTCCEQFLANNSQPALEHLTAHVRTGVAEKSSAAAYDRFRFRLVLVFREGDAVEREEVYRSAILRRDEVGVS